MTQLVAALPLLAAAWLVWAVTPDGEARKKRRTTKAEP